MYIANYEVCGCSKSVTLIRILPMYKLSQYYINPISYHKQGSIAQEVQ